MITAEKTELGIKLLNFFPGRLDIHGKFQRSGYVMNIVFLALEFIFNLERKGTYAKEHDLLMAKLSYNWTELI